MRTKEVLGAHDANVSSGLGVSSMFPVCVFSAGCGSVRVRVLERKREIAICFLSMHLMVMMVMVSTVH